MSQPLNHTPLDPDTLLMLGEAVESLSNSPKKEEPTIISPSPEAAPITLDTQNTQEKTPQNESAPVEEQQENAETTSQPVSHYVGVKPEDIELPEDLKIHGLHAVKHDDFPDFRNVKLPIPDEKVMEGSKAPMNTSIRWLAEFAKFLLWKAHISLKKVHGKVVRVVKK